MRRPAHTQKLKHDVFAPHAKSSLKFCHCGWATAERVWPKGRSHGEREGRSGEREGFSNLLAPSASTFAAILAFVPPSVVLARHIHFFTSKWDNPSFTHTRTPGAQSPHQPPALGREYSARTRFCFLVIVVCVCFSNWLKHVSTLSSCNGQR